MNLFRQPTENEEDLEERIRRDSQAWNGTACNCGGEVYYCEECCAVFSRAEVNERRITNNVRHHGHDHADCLLCGKELCDAGHMEVCEKVVV